MQVEWEQHLRGAETVVERLGEAKESNFIKQ
jgi:hypothetical protein